MGGGLGKLAIALGLIPGREGKVNGTEGRAGGGTGADTTGSGVRGFGGLGGFGTSINFGW